MAVVHHIAREYTAAGNPLLTAVQALIVLAVYFLLRVGEYTPKEGAKPKRTVPLRKCDIKLWRGHQQLNISDPREVLTTADGVTICLENQKNGQRGDVLHHTRASVPGATCPVKAAIQLLHPIRHMPESTPLGTYVAENGTTKRVRANNVRAGVRHAAATSGIEAQGYDLTKIGTHSLRAGGAVALKLAGKDEPTIMKMGRWNSKTFLIYIRNQIGNLTVGIATSMANALTYHNVN